MTLHRDIFWLGRQWAVTGHGLQAIDQRLKGVFDVEIARVWDEGALNDLRSQDWVNPADLEKAVAAARKRFPAPAIKAPLPAGAGPQPGQAAAPPPTSLKPTPPQPAPPKPVSPESIALPPMPRFGRAESGADRTAPKSLPNTPSRASVKTEPERTLPSLAAIKLPQELPPEAVPEKLVAALQVNYQGELARFAPQWRIRQ